MSRDIDRSSVRACRGVACAVRSRATKIIQFISGIRSVRDARRQRVYRIVALLPVRATSQVCGCVRDGGGACVRACGCPYLCVRVGLNTERRAESRGRRYARNGNSLRNEEERGATRREARRGDAGPPTTRRTLGYTLLDALARLYASRLIRLPLVAPYYCDVVRHVTRVRTHARLPVCRVHILRHQPRRTFTDTDATRFIR